MAVLLLPVVLLSSAASPMAVLLPPVVLRSSAPDRGRVQRPSGVAISACDRWPCCRSVVLRSAA